MCSGSASAGQLPAGPGVPDAGGPDHREAEGGGHGGDLRLRDQEQVQAEELDGAGGLHRQGGHRLLHQERLRAHPPLRHGHQGQQRPGALSIYPNIVK